jgi:putative tricarboxylic transport membrane protein
MVGLLFKTLKIPSTPLIIGFILGSMTEENLRQALMQSGGNWSIFVTRPISLVFLIVAVLSIVLPIIKKNKLKKAKSSL